MKYVWVVVEGSGSFPFDMLRYDSCYPRTEKDAHVAEHEHKRRRVMLTIAAKSSASERGPTSARWESFTWSVIGYGTERNTSDGCLLI